MAKSFDTWKAQSIGKKIDLDNQSYDCVDVSKSWGEFVNGVSWTKCCGWGNAKDLYANWSAAYWDKLRRGSVPKPGDVFVMNGTVGGGYGHTGVVLSVDGNNMTVAQQDTFKQVAVYTGVFSWNASYITGFLRPKVAFTVGAAAPVGYQRTVGVGGVNYRKSASRSGEVISLFPQGDILDFKGFVRGENVDGNNVWFVGRYTGGYAWSGGFTDNGTHDLTDMTPASAPALKPNERVVGSDVMNYRKTPKVAPDNVIRTFNPGEVLTFDAWIHGQAVDGNDIWFRGALTGGFMHSSGLVDSSTNGLTEITTVPVPQPVPTPTPAPGYTFTKDLACVTEVIPAGIGGFEYGNFPASPDKIVVHDFGTPNKDTIGSTINTFKNGANQVSAHFVVSGNRIVQMVSLKDRAYHAGPSGNGFVGIETDPVQDEATKTSVKLLLKALQLYYGKKQELILHSSLMKTACGDNVALDEYKASQNVIEPPITPPAPTEPPVTTKPNTDATVEAMKLLGRNGLLGAVSALILAVANWALTQLAGTSLPQEILIPLGGVLYAGLLYIDKWIHENPKIKSIGLIKF